MSWNAMFNSYALSLLILLFVAAPLNGQEIKPFIQADVYNALYEARNHCDDNLDQSRSELITEMFERYRGNSVSLELLKKLLTHNVQIAKQAIADKIQTREHGMPESQPPPNGSPDEDIDPAREKYEREKEVERIDEFVTAKERYVEVHECILATLWKTPRE